MPVALFRVAGNFFLNIAQQFPLLKIQKSILLIFLFIGGAACSQRTRFSLATDVGALHSFKEDQQFWCAAQTIAANFSFGQKDGLYAWFYYTINGKFSNDLTANAKSVFTVPLQVNFTNDANLRFGHISTGWKHYLKGGYESEKSWNLYIYGGFGLMFGTVSNRHSAIIDTADYVIPVVQGKGHFKRLTFDMGLGFETKVAPDIYFYTEGRLLLPTTDYPSEYLFVNDDAPLTGSINMGVRLFFNKWQ